MAADISTNDPVFAPEEKEPAQSMLATSRPGVTRYKRQIIQGIIGLGVALFVIGLIFAFVVGGGRQNSATEEEPKALQLANPDLEDLPKDYSDPLARPDLNGPGNTSLPAPGTDPNAANGQPGQNPNQQQPQQRYPQQRQLSPAEQRAQQARDLAIRQEMAARSGSIMFADNQRASAAGDDAGGAGGPGAGGAGAGDAQGQTARAGEEGEPGRQNLQGRKEDFIQSARIGADYLQNRIAPPRSRFEVKAGTIIPAALVTGLNSDLPGEVIATVTENVYDHVTGRYVLIPQGTRLFGRYDSRVAYKQSRALVVWNRIIYPNGNSINIGGMTASDATGASGISDRVNNHFGSLIKGITLSTAIAVGGAAADSAGTRDNQLVTAGGGALSQEASRTGQQIVTRELDRQPTITVRPGFRLRVIVNKDMILTPY